MMCDRVILEGIDSIHAAAILELMQLLMGTLNPSIELTLLKGHQRFDGISTLNLEVYKFWDW